MRVVVIGGGAAGFFAALSVKEHHPRAEVTLLEKSDKLLAKVRVSGGGRCNVTHDLLEPRKLAKYYPRGGTFLKKAFMQWSVKDTITWFAERDVPLKTERDGRMFPTTDSSGTIIQCLMRATEQEGVRIWTRTGVTRLEQVVSGNWQVHTSNGLLEAERVIVATGGSPKREGLDWLLELGHTIISPVPSLFTFNLPGQPITKLMGVVAEPARVRIEGTDLESEGPLLITHWGLSGPAVLRLSAWGARTLHQCGYNFHVRVNWLGTTSEEEARAMVRRERDASPKRHIGNAESVRLSGRLWSYLLERSGLQDDQPFSTLSRDGLNRLLAVLTNDRYEAKGKTTFKDEFVTAGGICLDDVDPTTMASRKRTGLHFAGEVLDVDGITGGFNFQAAWTTGMIAGKLVGQGRR